MKYHYYVLDDCVKSCGCYDFYILPAKNKEQAFIEFEVAWDHLGRYDQKKRSIFQLGRGYEADDGTVNIIKIIAEIK